MAAKSWEPRRWWRLAGLAGRLVIARTQRGQRRTFLAIGVVALAIGLLLVVTAVSLALAAPAAGGATSDYWLVPEEEGDVTSVVDVDGPQLGQSHQHAALLRDRNDVVDATPVLLEVVQMRTPEGENSTHVLAVGVVPTGSETRVAGVSTRPFDPGDPHFADGSYTGPWTGDVVLSPAAASLLAATEGDSLTIGSTSTFRTDGSFEVRAVDDGAGGESQIPVAVLRLSELQTLTGATDGDHADRILLQTTDDANETELAATVSDASLVSGTMLAPTQLADSDLPLAMSLAALVVGLLISALFVATVVGLEVESRRTELAVLAAVGISHRGRLTLIGATAVWLALCGGIAGLVLGTVGIVATNTLAAGWLGVPVVALWHPLLVPYALGFALVTGVLAAPYPLWLLGRLGTAGVISQ